MAASHELSTPRALARLIPFAKPVLPRLLAGVGAAVVAALLALAIPLVLEWTVDGPMSSDDPAQVVWASLAVLGLGVLEAFFIFARRALVLIPATRIEYDVRQRFYRRLQRLPVAFHDRWQSGQLLSRMMSDINLVRRWIAFGAVLLVVNLITIVVGSIVLFRWHWALGTVFLLVSLPLVLVAFRFERVYGKLSRLSQDQAGDLATAVEESVHGIRVLKAFGRGRHALDRFVGQVETLRSTELRKARESARVTFWFTSLPGVSFAVSLLVGIVLVGMQQLTVGELFAFFTMATALRWPVNSIGFLFSFLLDVRTATDRIFEVLDEGDTIVDPDDPVEPNDPKGRLTFRDVHFRYQDARASERDLLDGVDLEVEPGETMAIVGLTGSGKTTLTTLPTRLYDVTGGAVELDGVDVRRLRLDTLRTEIAMAFEDATLFSTSVRDNVLLGREDLDPSSAEADRVVREAIDVAQAHFVYELPDGLDTTVGEEGLSLSGGQRQRLALARAVAARPRVLVLDDPLSALDVDTEAKVQEGLRRVLDHTTALVVAHRPSTVVLADRVAVLEDGRVTAVGAHADLIRTSEHYRHVISSLDAAAQGSMTDEAEAAR